jgi:uncharacterized protein YaiI (UPF0178 family)
MIIWVDADACPRPIKEILFRAAMRTETSCVLVTNQLLSLPKSPFIRLVQVEKGFDVADHYILQHIQGGDLLISGDILLADAAILKKALALTPRGKRFTTENIKACVARRNFVEGLRDSGALVTGGPSTLGSRDIYDFSCELDRLLQRYCSRKKSGDSP